MSAKFTTSGNIKVDAGIQYVKLRMDISWNDSAATYGIALKSLSFSADDRTVEWSRDTSNESGSADRTFKISGQQSGATEVSINYQSQGTSLNVVKQSDKKIIFLDGDGSDANATITLSIEESVPFSATPPPVVPPGGGFTPAPPLDCPPGPWSDPNVPPSCGSPPSGISSSDGLQISITGQNQITLNLKNYANKLVSLRITHQVDAAWTQSFNFNIPNCSDISPDTGGAPYSKGAYSNSNITGTNVFYVYNIDGGNNNYVFNHSSIPGPAPTRQLYSKQCTITCDEEGNCVETCACVPSGIESFGPWPYCNTGVAISKNGGDRVQWQYEDGGGGSYDDQFVTVEVIGVRNAISSVGAVCTSALKANVWIPDSTQAGIVGNCIGNYKNHSQKIRFRIPSLKVSKTTFSNPVCSSSFRGIAGAIPPSQQLGTISSEYSVLHLFNDDFYTTTSLISGNGIIVTPQNLDDDYHSPFNETNPQSNTSLGTLDRRYYTVQFTDGTQVTPGAQNIGVTVGQNVTAGGLNTNITVFKKEQVNTNTMRVWFYTSYSENVQFTNDIIHVFDDDLNTTNTSLSKLVDPGSIIITPQSLTDPGNGTAGFETLNQTNKKHYLITFSDDTIVQTGGTNIEIDVNRNLTASGLTVPGFVSKKERVDDKNLRVWFTWYYADRPVGLENDNGFARDWSVRRIKPENSSGNVFVRNWYLSKIN